MKSKLVRYSIRLPLSASISLVLLLTLSAPALAGFNATAPKPARRIFTQIAFAENRLITYHVLEPGPVGIESFPVDHATGKLLRFPGCPNLRPVLDDSAAPSPDAKHLIPDAAMREVFNVQLAQCGVQPKTVNEALAMAVSVQSIGFVNAPGVPAPVGAAVPVTEQQTADELFGPLPNPGVVDVFAGGNLWPQHSQATTDRGFRAANVQQPDVRRARISAYAAGRLVYFITYETKNLSQAGLVSKAVEAQWSRTGFPGERDLFFLAYGRAPLPPNAALPAGSLDSNGIPNDNQAVLNVVKGAPFWHPGDYSPLWKMSCVIGGISPAIGPGFPCGSVRFYQTGQPRTVAEMGALGLRIEGGVFRDINCPVIGTDVNDDGVFANSGSGKELVQFPNIDWDGNGLPDNGINDPNSTLQ